MVEQVSQRISRLLALVPWLAKRPGITMTKTAEHFGISVDTLTKDLWQLVLCGRPGYGPDQLVDIDFWDNDRIWVQNPQTLALPMRINSDEAIALSIALRRMNQIPGVAEKESINRLIGKMDAVTGSAAGVVEIPSADQSVQSELIEAALVGGLSLRFDYSTARDEHSSRTVMPIKVFSVDDYLYLSAWCDQAEAVRSFRFDRMAQVVLSEPSEPREPSEPGSPDPTDEVTGLTDLALAPVALVLLEAELAWVTEEVWVSRATENPRSLLDGQVLVHVPYLSKDWLIRWILSMGGAAVVLEPADCAEEITVIVKRAISRLGDSG